MIFVLFKVSILKSPKTMTITWRSLIKFSNVLKHAVRDELGKWYSSIIHIVLCEKLVFVISITDMPRNVSCFERTISRPGQKARFLCLTPQELK